MNSRFIFKRAKLKQPLNHPAGRHQFNFFKAQYMHRPFVILQCRFLLTLAKPTDDEAGLQNVSDSLKLYKLYVTTTIKVSSMLFWVSRSS